MDKYRGFKGVFGIPAGKIKDSQSAGNILVKHDGIFYYKSEDPEKTLMVDGDLVLLFQGRIDNLDELLAKLNLTAAPTDIELVFHAYQQFGEKALTYLIGDFSFAIYNKRNKKLILARDQIGVKPMFYIKKDNCLYFATTISDLVSILPGKEPVNKEYIARELLGFEQELKDTFYENIKRLQPAHYLAVEDDVELHLRRYWDLEPIDLSAYNTDEEIYSLLLKTLEEAVSCRIRKAHRVGTQFSGGLDSSAITVLLSRLIDKKHLHTYSFVLNEKTSAYSEDGIDEKNTQQIVLDYAGLFKENHHPVEKFHFKSVFEEFESTQSLFAGPTNSNTVWQESMYKRAAEENQVNIMFSGFPGDEGISYGGGMYYFDYLGNFNLREISELIFSQPLEAIKMIAHYYLSLMRGTTRKQYKRNLKRRSLLNPESEYNTILRDHTFRFYSTFKKFYKAQMLRSHNHLRIESEGLYAGKHGVETVYPLADIRLLQLVYSLPTRFFKPEPYKRPIMRNLCKTLLPDEIRLQPKYNGAFALAFAEYWAHSNYESLKDYWIEDRLGMFIDIDQFEKNNTGSELMFKRGVVNLKRMDYLINRNWPETL